MSMQLVLVIALTFSMGIEASNNCRFVMESLYVVSEAGMICALLQQKESDTRPMQLIEKNISISYRAHDNSENRISLTNKHCYDDGVFSVSGSQAKPSIVLCGKPTHASHLTQPIIFEGVFDMYFHVLLSNNIVECKLSKKNTDGNEVPSINIAHPTFCEEHSVCPHAKTCMPTCRSLMEGNGSAIMCTDNLSDHAVIANSVRAQTSTVYFVWDRSDSFVCMDLTFDYLSNYNGLDAVLMVSENGTNVSFRSNLTRHPYRVTVLGGNTYNCTSLQDVPFFANRTGHICAHHSYLRYLKGEQLKLYPKPVLRYNLTFSDGSFRIGNITIHPKPELIFERMTKFESPFCTSRNKRSCGDCRQSCTYRLTGGGPVQCTKEEGWIDDALNGNSEYQRQRNVLQRVERTTQPPRVVVTEKPLSAGNSIEANITAVPKNVSKSNNPEQGDTDTLGEPEFEHPLLSTKLPIGNAGIYNNRTTVSTPQPRSLDANQGNDTVDSGPPLQTTKQPVLNADDGGTVTTPKPGGLDANQGNHTLGQRNSGPPLQSTEQPALNADDEMEYDEVERYNTLPHLPSTQQSTTVPNSLTHKGVAVPENASQLQEHMNVTPHLPKHIDVKNSVPSTNVYWTVCFSVVTLIVIFLLVVVCKHHCVGQIK